MAIWTIQAQRQLRQRMNRQLCDNADAFGDLVSQINEILSHTFPNADHIVVLNQLTGYRPKHGIQTLLVEVGDAVRGGQFVVKIGPAKYLDIELRGWDQCRPPGLRHDLVLLPLEAGWRQPTEGLADGESQQMSLVYGDAQQFIGVEQTVSLEDAFLDAVQYGNPSVQSVGFVIVEMLERLGHLLYVSSHVEDPGEEGYVFRMPRVVRAIRAWKSETLHQSIRTDANVLVTHGASQFIDPIDYFETWVLSSFSYEDLRPDGSLVVVEKQCASAEESAESSLMQPAPHDIVPRILRGFAHGDLHGRNVLVGLVNERALWPTVFDYEDMRTCGVPGWDFVKLETELKIRAWREIFPRDEREYLDAVWKFERELDQRTEKCHHDGNWPIVSEPEHAIDRLYALLLEIHRMAAIHLGKNRGRPRQWLEEYFFLQAAYGINAGSYANLERRELIAVYVAAGVAVSRLSWPIRRERDERTWIGL